MVIRMFSDYARYHLGLGEKGQGTMEYTILSGLAVLGMVIAFDVLDLGTVLGTWLKNAVNAVTASKPAP